MHTIAILKIFWNNEYCHEGYLSSSSPVLKDLALNWKEVNDDEYSELKKFLRDRHSVFCDSEEGCNYVMVEEIDDSFEKDFEKWKLQQREEAERIIKRQEQYEKNAKAREEKKKAKQVEKAKKLLAEVSKND